MAVIYANKIEQSILNIDFWLRKNNLVRLNLKFFIIIFEHFSKKVGTYAIFRKIESIER